MFRWCSYCQGLIGEVAPFSDYRVTHGICASCNQKLESHTEVDLLRARSVFNTLEEAGRGGSLEACDRAIDGALDFGLKPSDIIIGILHPALYRIGDLWERGEITVADENRFTTFALGLIDRIEFPDAPPDRPMIVLANHPESCHDVGLRILQFLTWENGIPCERIEAGGSEARLLDIAVRRSPALFGLSVGLVELIPAAVELAEAVARRLPDTSRVVLGGQAFRRSTHHRLPESITVIKSIDEYRLLLHSIRDRYLRSQHVDPRSYEKNGEMR